MIFGNLIYLSSLNKESIEQLRAWRNNTELRKYFREYREISKEMQEKWFENTIGNRFQVDFEIHDITEKNLIGHCGLYYIHWVNRTAEFTIYIGNVSFRKKGYGSDALKTLLNYGFNELNLNRIYCEVFSNNEAIKVYRKIGFKDEGVLKEHYYCDGKYWDSYILGMLKKEWNLLNKNEKEI